MRILLKRLKVSPGTAMQTATETLFTELHAKLTQAVLNCRADTSVKSVHTLRTTTRRLEGLLYKTLEDHPRAKMLHESTGKTLRQLKKVRRLAGTVRDLDVHQKLLKKVIEKSTSTAAEKDTPHYDQQQLHHYLEQKREQAADILASGLARREIRLERSLERTAIALEQLSPSSTDPLTTARRWVEHWTLHLHGLNVENLHDFRKQTKLARYVSEMHPPSKAARGFTRDLLAAQDAIGAWHDLQLLHQEAKAVCGKHAELTRFLATLSEESLKKALAKAGATHRPQSTSQNHLSS
jgi:CHAD domain-containing protein